MATQRLLLGVARRSSKNYQNPKFGRTVEGNPAHTLLDKSEFEGNFPGPASYFCDNFLILSSNFKVIQPSKDGSFL